MAVVDALARLLPGSLADDRSSEEESFAPALDGALEYPHYTRPAEWRGHGVPEVLLSGHHARIDAWRREQASARARRRPRRGDAGGNGDRLACGCSRRPNGRPST